MRPIYFLSLLFLSSIGFSIERKNVPFFEPNKQNVIHFCTQKDFSNGALREELVAEIKRNFKLDLFVESGTHFGDTSKVAARLFERVLTIELLPEFYERSVNTLSQFSNVTVYLGDSAFLLEKLLPSCDKKVLFYLDGHFDGGLSGRGNKNTPIMEELDAIRKWGKSDSVIWIDDLVDFYPSSLPGRIVNTCFEEYPTLGQVLDALLSINPDYKFCFIANSLLAYPPSEDVTLSPVLSSCAIDILSTVCNLFTEEELRHAEEVIGSSTGSEREALKFYYQCYSGFERYYGWYSFSTFWMGLLHLNEANQLFTLCSESSIPDWRVDSYLMTKKVPENTTQASTKPKRSPPKKKR